MKAVEQPPHGYHGTIQSGIGGAGAASTADAGRIALRSRGAEQRQEGRHAGRCRRLACTDEVIEAAEKLGAGIAKALLGKAAVPDELPFVTGSIGLLGTKPSYDMMMAAIRCS